MKKLALFLILILTALVSFSQTYTPRRLYGNYQFVVCDTTSCDTIFLYPSAGYIKTDTVVFGDGTKQSSAFTGQYLSANGDTVLGKTYLFNDGHINVTKLLGGSLCAMTFEKTNIRGGQIDFETCDGTQDYIGSIGADSLVSDGLYTFSVPSVTFTGDVAVDGDLTITGKLNGLVYNSDSVLIADDASIVLTNGISGWGEVYAFNAGAIDEWAEFIISSDGAVYLKSNSTDAVNTDTDDKLCIFDNGSGVTIRNRLGNARTIKYIIHH
jgi:hypothetical protein